MTCIDYARVLDLNYFISTVLAALLAIEFRFAYLQLVATAVESIWINSTVFQPDSIVNLLDEQSQGSQFLKVGLHSFVDEEEKALQEGKSFVNLPLIKKYATLIGAVASWDSNLHYDDLLNKITASGEYIYLVVTVKILIIFHRINVTVSNWAQLIQLCCLSIRLFFSWSALEISTLYAVNAPLNSPLK